MARPHNLFAVVYSGQIFGITTKKPRALMMAEEITVRLMLQKRLTGKVEIKPFRDGHLELNRLEVV